MKILVFAEFQVIRAQYAFRNIPFSWDLLTPCPLAHILQIKLPIFSKLIAKNNKTQTSKLAGFLMFLLFAIVSDCGAGDGRAFRKGLVDLFSEGASWRVGLRILEA